MGLEIANHLHKCLCENRFFYYPISLLIIKKYSCTQQHVHKIKYVDEWNLIKHCLAQIRVVRIIIQGKLHSLCKSL